jgi:hypothetical protein
MLHHLSLEDFAACCAMRELMFRAGVRTEGATKIKGQASCRLKKKALSTL